MYFAILWKHPQISLAELQIVQPTFFPSTKKGIVLFETKNPEQLKTLWWCIKSGIIVAEKELQTLLQDVKIIGIQEEAIGKHFKRTIGIRRFKTVKINHTDREIKEKGKEIINLDNGKYWIVENYQNIPLYETIDFEKPGRSMNMGMMPAKLTHILINLGIQNTIANKQLSHYEEEWNYNLAIQNKKSSNNITIYDPFCGSGTTNLLANYMDYNTIGSDINISYAEKNLPWRQTTAFYNSNTSISFFNHDTTKPIPSNLSSPSNPPIIITEWRLGPIITKKSNSDDIKKAQQQITKLYTNFFKNILESDFFSTIICTIPWYIGHDNIHEQYFQKTIQDLGYGRKSISEIYQREDQQVGRKICIVTKKGS